ncbi:kynureninase [Martiniozyma asiatica (nom. inval.)]|nr:kynureninase [Martiniozyma asiatica]
MEKSYKDLFVFPTRESMGLNGSGEVTYLCGNSLGLMPKSTREYLNRELDAWGAKAVESHFRNGITHDWVNVDIPLLPSIQNLVGAQNDEVAIMGTLTMNLNSLLISFYKPSGQRNKILFEKGAFPSDYYALFNLAKLHNLDPKNVLVQLEPRKGEFNLRTKDIIDYINQNGNEIALLCFPGIQYYSGQLFEIEKITKAAHAKGCIVGWDLAHAVGNVNLKLHDWDVDFAAWCSYKYLNAGPGAIGGIFVNTKHSKSGQPRLAGWWGNNSEERFKMLEKFEPMDGALGFRQSNPSVLDVAALKSSLDIFDMVGGIDLLRRRSIKLTQYLENLLRQSIYYCADEQKDNISPHFLIITPQDAEQRGAQLSLLFKPENIMEKIFKYLNDRGCICDERRPNVIRIAPTPLYNTIEDCDTVVKLLQEAFASLLA